MSTNALIIAGFAILLLTILLIGHRLTKKINHQHSQPPTIISPSYWITPNGRSWYPPHHHHHHDNPHNLGPGGLPPIVKTKFGCWTN